MAQQLQELEGLHLNTWYLDHGTLVGTLQALQAAWDILVEEGEPRGLKLSLTKSIVMGADTEPEEDPLDRGVPGLAAAVGGVKLLGAPLGIRLFKTAILGRRVGGIKRSSYGIRSPPLLFCVSQIHVLPQDNGHQRPQ